MINFTKGKGFLRVPYNNQARAKVQRTMGVSMLPTLVVMDAASGKVLTDWGRTAVSKNGKGAVASWRNGGTGAGWTDLCTIQ